MEKSSKSSSLSSSSSPFSFSSPLAFHTLLPHNILSQMKKETRDPEVFMHNSRPKVLQAINKRDDKNPKGFYQISISLFPFVFFPFLFFLFKCESAPHTRQ
ncbi:hypothetical protein Dimus_038098 [Dionaea muscipula]